MLSPSQSNMLGDTSSYTKTKSHINADGVSQNTLNLKSNAAIPTNRTNSLIDKRINELKIAKIKQEPQNMYRSFTNFKKPKQTKESRQREMFSAQGPNANNAHMQNYINVAYTKFKAKVKRHSMEKKLESKGGESMSNTYSYQTFDMKNLNARRASNGFPNNQNHRLISSKVGSIQNSSLLASVPKNTLQSKSHITTNQKNSINVEFRTTMEKNDGYKATMTMTLMNDTDGDATRNSITHEETKSGLKIKVPKQPSKAQLIKQIEGNYNQKKRILPSKSG